MEKTKGTVKTTSGVIGTSGIAGIIKSVTINGNGAAAGTAALYDGTGTTGTNVYTITCTATAGDSKSSPPLSIYCASGIYLAITTATSVSVEYAGGG